MSLKNLIESSSSTLSMKAESMAPATSYTTNGFIAAFGALTFNETMVLVGTALALATFGVNFWFQCRRDRREQELHRKRMDSSAARPSKSYSDSSD